VQAAKQQPLIQNSKSTDMTKTTIQESYSPVAPIKHFESVMAYDNLESRQSLLQKSDAKD